MSNRPPIWDRPRNGFVLTLILASLGAAFTLYGRQSELAGAVAHGARDSDDLRQRVASLEAFARNCKP